MVAPSQTQELKKTTPKFAPGDLLVQNNNPSKDAISNFLYSNNYVSSQEDMINRADASNWVMSNSLNSSSENGQPQESSDLYNLSFQFGSVALTGNGLNITEAFKFLERIRHRIYEEISRGLYRQGLIAKQSSESLSDAAVAKISEILSSSNAPDVSIWDEALRFLDLATTAIKQLSIDDAIFNLRTAGKKVSSAHQMITNYTEGVNKGAERALVTLEYTKIAGGLAVGVLTAGSGTVVGVAAGATYTASQQLAEQYTSVSIGTAKKIDLEGIAIDAIINVVIGMFMRLISKHPGDKFSIEKSIKQFLTKTIKNLFTKGTLKGIGIAKLQALVQTLAKSGYDKSRGRTDKEFSKLIGEAFVLDENGEISLKKIVEGIILDALGVATNTATESRHNNAYNNTPDPSVAPNDNTLQPELVSNSSEPNLVTDRVDSPESSSSRQNPPKATLEGENLPSELTKPLPSEKFLPAGGGTRVIDVAPTKSESIPAESNPLPTTGVNVVKGESSRLTPSEKLAKQNGQSNPQAPHEKIPSEIPDLASNRLRDRPIPTEIDLGDSSGYPLKIIIPGDGMHEGISGDLPHTRRPLKPNAKLAPEHLADSATAMSSFQHPAFKPIKRPNPERLLSAPITEKSEGTVPAYVAASELARNTKTEMEARPQLTIPSPSEFGRPPTESGMLMAGKNTMRNPSDQPQGGGSVVEIPLPGLPEQVPKNQQASETQSSSTGEFTPIEKALLANSMISGVAPVSEISTTTSIPGSVGLESSRLNLKGKSPKTIGKQSSTPTSRIEPASTLDNFEKGANKGSIESGLIKSLEDSQLTIFQHDDLELNFSSENGALGLDLGEIPGNQKIPPAKETHPPENVTGNAWEVKSSAKLIEPKPMSPESVVAPRTLEDKPNSTKSPVVVSKTKQNPLGKMWDHKTFPTGVGKLWEIGDPIDMPSADGYPVWSTIRERIWKTLAHNELEARKSGMTAQDTSNPLDLDPVKSLTDLELQEMLENGTGRKGFEVEHSGIPQRVITLLEGAGLPLSEARRVAHLGDPNNLEVVPRELHAIYDEIAADMFNRYRNPELPSALDDRRANPLGSANERQIMEILDSIKKFKLDLGNSAEGQRLRDMLQKENARRGNKWIIP